MLVWIRDILGQYSPLTDTNGNVLEGVASLNIEYIVSAILLVMSIWFAFKLIISIFRK